MKAAVVSRALRRCPEVQEILIHTGQHYDLSMSDIFFEELGIPAPDYHLKVGSGDHGDQTGRMLQAIEPVLLMEKPDWVLVYGDTNSTLAGALAAVKLKIPVAHVEAGQSTCCRCRVGSAVRPDTDCGRKSRTRGGAVGKDSDGRGRDV